MDETVNGLSTTGRRIRVVVISPVRIHLEGLAHLLETEDGVELAGTAPTLDAVAPLLSRRPVDVVLLDMTGDMAGERGLDVLLRLAGTVAMPCVILGVPGRATDVVAYAEAGIAGYVTAEESFADLVVTLRSATRGEFSCQAHVVADLVGRLATLSRERRLSPVAHLTSRELEIIVLIESGCSNKEIARLLYIQLTTVKNHVHNILEKLGVRGRGEAAAAVRRQQALVPVLAGGSGSRAASNPDPVDSCP
jgi:DNA-binding NarL/FixJ family response regulator